MTDKANDNLLNYGWWTVGRIPSDHYRRRNKAVRELCTYGSFEVGSIETEEAICLRVKELEQQGFPHDQ
jgi:hypothetical protein